MTGIAVVPECRRRIEHEEDDLNRVRALTVAAEPSVQRHLEEALCSFAIGVYRGAIVAAWCAVEEYLRLVLKGMGAHMYDTHRRDAKDKPVKGGLSPDDWHGESLFNTCIALEVFPDWSKKDLGDELQQLYKRRCECAHSSPATIRPADVSDFLARVEWLLKGRRAAQEELQNPNTLVNAIRTSPPLDDRVVRELCEKLSARARERLAEIAYERLTSDPSPRNEAKESMEFWLRLWSVAIRGEVPGYQDPPPLLTPAARSLLLASMAKRLAEHVGEPDSDRAEPTDDLKPTSEMGIEPNDVVKTLILWPDLDVIDDASREQIWRYLEARRDHITPFVARETLPTVPDGHRQRFLAVLPQAAGR